MKAILVAPIVDANADLPVLTHGDPLQGGFTGAGNFPMPDCPTCLVLVDTSAATVAAMVAGDYLFVEEIALADPKPAQPAHELPDRAAVVQWLRNHGYSPALLNAKIPEHATANGVRRGIQELHGVSEAEYARAR